MARPVTVRIVTDSSSCLPPGWAEEHGVTVIPQGVVVDGRAYRENVDLSADDFYRMLERGAVATSSQPRPEDLRAAYRGVGAHTGADGAAAGPGGTAASTGEILSIHISSDLSGTLSAAAAFAADLAPGRVHLVDSKSAGLGLGFLVMEAARRAAAGAAAADIAAALEDMVPRVRVYFLLHTMAYLVRGGRVGRAAGLAASLLRVRPLLTFQGGRTTPVSRDRSERAANARLWELIAASAGRGLHYAGFHYALNRAEVDGWRREFTLRYGVEAELTQLGPAVGAHSGPRILGVVLVESV